VDQDQLSIFISSVRDYFTKMTKTPIEIGVPFLKSDSSNLLLDHTGVIGISGKMKGAVYITAEKEMVVRLIGYITKNRGATDEDCAGMIGEFANTIAGNAQKTLGPEFHISVPIVLVRQRAGESGSIIIKAPTFIIPLKWLDSTAYLVVGLLPEDEADR
jgi:chemotaxis protein CheX